MIIMPETESRKTSVPDFLICGNSTERSSAELPSMVLCEIGRRGSDDQEEDRRNT